MHWNFVDFSDQNSTPTSKPGPRRASIYGDSGCCDKNHEKRRLAGILQRRNVPSDGHRAPVWNRFLPFFRFCIEFIKKKRKFEIFFSPNVLLFWHRGMDFGNRSANFDESLKLWRKFKIIV